MVAPNLLDLDLRNVLEPETVEEVTNILRISTAPLADPRRYRIGGLLATSLYLRHTLEDPYPISLYQKPDAPRDGSAPFGEHVRLKPWPNFFKAPEMVQAPDGELPFVPLHEQLVLLMTELIQYPNTEMVDRVVELWDQAERLELDIIDQAENSWRLTRHFGAHGKQLRLVLHETRSQLRSLDRPR